jgi:CRP-like cAMP-binding protein
MGIFAGATRRELESVCGLMTEVRLPAGRVLCAQGEDALEVFLVVEGEVAVSLDRRPLGVVGAGGVLGELGVLDTKPRSATAVAITDVVTLVMSTGEFAQLLDQLPVVATNLQSIRASRTEELVALLAA